MKENIKEILLSLPLHDSSLMGLSITQNDDGDTDLCLKVTLCEGEFEDLTEYKGTITQDGQISIIFTDCEWININAFCNRAQKDSVDYLEFKKESSELEKRRTTKDQELINVVFTSGSIIECITDSIELACI